MGNKQYMAGLRVSLIAVFLISIIWIPVAECDHCVPEDIHYSSPDPGMPMIKFTRVNPIDQKIHRWTGRDKQPYRLPSTGRWGPIACPVCRGHAKLPLLTMWILGR